MRLVSGPALRKLLSSSNSSGCANGGNFAVVRFMAGNTERGGSNEEAGTKPKNSSVAGQSGTNPSRKTEQFYRPTKQSSSSIYSGKIVRRASCTAIHCNAIFSLISFYVRAQMTFDICAMMNPLLTRTLVLSACAWLKPSVWRLATGQTKLFLVSCRLQDGVFRDLRPQKEWIGKRADNQTRLYACHERRKPEECK